MLATGLMVAYGYVFETFTAWYSGDISEQARPAKVDTRASSESCSIQPPNV
jgi:hypothetical protein